MIDLMNCKSDVLVAIYKSVGISIPPTPYEEMRGWMEPDGTFTSLKDIRLAVEAD